MIDAGKIEPVRACWRRFGCGACLCNERKGNERAHGTAGNREF
jgi:hypothetical protein